MAHPQGAACYAYTPRCGYVLVRRQHAIPQGLHRC